MPSSGPKGRIPWIELCRENKQPEILSDSTFISKAMVEQGMFSNLNGSLSLKEKAQDIAVRSMLEEKLFFINGRERWIDNFYAMRDYVMASIPWPLRVIAGSLAYRENMQKFHAKGVGRYTDQELDVLRREAWESINGFLQDSRQGPSSDQCYWILGGDAPNEADTSVYGFIISTLVATADPESAKMLRHDFPVLVDYATPIHGRYFPEYQKW